MQVQQLQVQQRQQRQKQRKGANTSDLRQQLLEARAHMQNQQLRRRRRPQQTNYLLLATGYRDNKDLKQTQDDNFKASPCNSAMHGIKSTLFDS